MLTTPNCALSEAVKRDPDRVRFLLDAKRLQEDYRLFVPEAWKVIHPGRRLRWNWHLDLICEYMQAFRVGEIQFLIVNIPPRTGKSTLISQFFMPWVWTVMPHKQFLCISADDDLVVRDSTIARDLICSRWYQDRWSDVFSINADQNQKANYKNDKNGSRISLGITSNIVGKGADMVTVDDPLDPKDGLSDAKRLSANNTLDQSIMRRLNDEVAQLCLVMQRFHINDMTGHVLAKEESPFHILSIPMEFDPRLSKSTFLPGRDPRKTPGELLDPNGLYPPKRVRQAKIDMGAYGFGGQFQQDPSPPGGGIYHRQHWRRWTKGMALPEFFMIMVSWDTAFNEKDEAKSVLAQSAQSAYTVWGVFVDPYDPKPRKQVMLISAWADWVPYHKLLKIGKEVNEKWKPDTQIIEAKASGHSLIQDMRRYGIPVRPYTPKKGEGKTERAHIGASVCEAGLVWVPEGAHWGDWLIDECSKVPQSGNWDLVDTVSQALMWIKRGAILENDDDDPEDDDDEFDRRNVVRLRPAYG